MENNKSKSLVPREKIRTMKKDIKDSKTNKFVVKNEPLKPATVIKQVPITPPAPQQIPTPSSITAQAPRPTPPPQTPQIEEKKETPIQQPPINNSVPEINKPKEINNGDTYRESIK